jgi:hypothetical protein
VAAVIMSVISVALVVGFFRNPGESPLGLLGAILVGLVLAVFLDLPI